MAPDRSLVSLDPLPAGAEALIGVRVGSGFRRALDEALPGEAAASSALYLLLDDLPVAALISGYADLYAGRLPVRSEAAILSSQADICAGWASGGTMLTLLDETGSMPTPVGPPAPDLDADGGWHPVPPLGVGGMRRRRLVEVSPAGAGLAVNAMFRDTHTGPDEVERVLHEYRLRAEVELPSGTVTDSRAEPMVLPWPECPGAAGSASELVGRRIGRLREFVRAELRGTRTCTHLNDLLRSLADVPALARSLGVPLQSDG